MQVPLSITDICSYTAIAISSSRAYWPHILHLRAHHTSMDTTARLQPISQATGTVVPWHSALLPSSFLIVSLTAVLYTYREPCHAVPHVVSLSRVTSYLVMQGVPFCLTRHCTHPDSNWSAPCACSLGPVTPRASISPRTASSAGNRPLGTQLQMTWTQQRTVMSTIGWHVSHRRTTPSRHSLSQLTELVWQLLPQPAQAATQSADAGNMPPVSSPVEDQAAGTSGASLGLPPPSWSHPRDTASGVSPGDHQTMLVSPVGQPSSSPHGNPLPAAPAPWHCLTGRHLLYRYSSSIPGLPQLALACLARGQHPACSNCPLPQIYLQHKSLLPSKGNPAQ